MSPKAKGKRKKRSAPTNPKDSEFPETYPRSTPDLGLHGFIRGPNPWKTRLLSPDENYILHTHKCVAAQTMALMYNEN